jgi:CRISPR/Cas system-associated exonuclease Cas4 (RecB family)
MERLKYHQSEIKTFLRCGKMWEFRYELGIKIPPSAALTVGSSVDHAVSENLSKKLSGGAGMSREEVLDQFSQDFERRAVDTAWDEMDPGEQKDVGVKLVELHHSVVAPKIEPASVQESFEIRTDAPYDLGGTIDHTERSGMIVDTKTSRIAYDENAVTRSLQAAMYDYAYEAINGEPAQGFRYDVLIKPTARQPARLQQVTGKVTAADRKWLFETTARVHRAISSGVALPAPEGSWFCSAKWCGYWHMCKGKKE